MGSGALGRRLGELYHAAIDLWHKSESYMSGGSITRVAAKRIKERNRLGLLVNKGMVIRSDGTMPKKMEK